LPLTSIKYSLPTNTPFRMNNSEKFEIIKQEALSKGYKICVDIVLFNSQGKIFIQKRSPDRKMFPNCWELPGGHIEPNESIEQCLIRELKEETGMEISTFLNFTEYYDCYYKDQVYRHIFAAGKPKSTEITLEKDKATDYKWIDKSELDLFHQGRPPKDLQSSNQKSDNTAPQIINVIQKAFLFF